MSIYLKGVEEDTMTFSLSVCDHWYLQIILYFLCSPGNLYFLPH